MSTVRRLKRTNCKLYWAVWAVLDESMSHENETIDEFIAMSHEGLVLFNVQWLFNVYNVVNNHHRSSYRPIVLSSWAIVAIVPWSPSQWTDLDYEDHETSAHLIRIVKISVWLNQQFQAGKRWEKSKSQQKSKSLKVLKAQKSRKDEKRWEKISVSGEWEWDQISIECPDVDLQWVHEDYENAGTLDSMDWPHRRHEQHEERSSATMPSGRQAWVRFRMRMSWRRISRRGKIILRS